MEWIHCSVRPRNQQLLLGLDAAIILCTENATTAHPCVNKKCSKWTTQPFIFLPPPKILLMPSSVQTQLRTRAETHSCPQSNHLPVLTPGWGKEKRGDLSRQTEDECLLHVKAMRYFNKTIRDRKWRVTNDWGSEMKQDSVVGWIWDVPRRLMSLNTGPQIGTLSWKVIVGSKRWVLEGYNPDLLLGLSVFFTLTWRDLTPPSHRHKPNVMPSLPWWALPSELRATITLSSQVAAIGYLFWHNKRSMQYKVLSLSESQEESWRRTVEEFMPLFRFPASLILAILMNQNQEKNPKWLDHLAVCKECWASERNDSMPSRF